MKTKQEVIQEAWIKSVGIERYESLKEELVLDGFLHFQPKSLTSTDIKIIDGSPFYRPKSLQGIENNNGWISVFGNMPPENSGLYFVYDGKDIGIARMSVLQFRSIKSNEVYSDVTHYKPIVKPKPPLY